MARAKKKRSMYMLTEPDWKKIQTGTNPDELDTAYKDAMYFIHYEIGDKQCIAAFKAWMKDASGWDVETQRQLNKLPDYNFRSSGQSCYVWQKTGYLPANVEKYIRDKMPEQLEKAKKLVEIKEEIAAKPKVVKIRQNLPDALEFVELGVDYILDGKKAPSLNQLESFNLNQAEINEFFEILDKERGEFEELTRVRLMKNRSDWDEQLVEGYSNIKKSTTKDLIAWYNDVASFIMNIKQTKKITRIRRKKPTDKAKVVKRLRYLQEFKDLDIKSENPVDIIGASEVWYYDVKRKRLGVYKSEFSGGLGVKGTSIDNYDVDSSYEKTVRKPDEVLAMFKKARANGLHKFMNDGIRGKKMIVRKRLQPNSVLLRILT
jgi:hypothetical protein